jgi:hypothetical protein
MLPSAAPSTSRPISAQISNATSDVSQTKLKSGRATDNFNLRTDVTLSNSITINSSLSERDKSLDVFNGWAFRTMCQHPVALGLLDIGVVVR